MCVDFNDCINAAYKTAEKRTRKTNKKKRKKKERKKERKKEEETILIRHYLILQHRNPLLSFTLLSLSLLSPISSPVLSPNFQKLSLFTIDSLDIVFSRRTKKLSERVIFIVFLGY
ncbi:hypothetical protein K0M31_020205 [Melipona bicolor]|uniref:Uncharacterized protein n=1 Tax=Melipona bicolor TaxID=60889 RepID=A0AA40G155_9HYME|nr:hypothetical protein K0M31_020205 [Melipona bicolor]